MSNQRLLPTGFAQRSLSQLGQARSQDPLYHFLETQAIDWVSSGFDDFVGDTINLDNYAVAVLGTGTAFAVPATAVANGVIEATTGTATSCSCSLVTPAIYSGTASAILSTRLYLDNVTGINFEVGFIDVVPGSNNPFVTSATAGTFASTNGAVLSMNAANGIPTMVFASIGNSASQTAAVTTLSVTSATLPAPFITPTATTYFDVTVQLIQTYAYLFINNKLVARHENATNGNINKAQNLAAWLYVQSRVAGGAARTMRVDYFWPRARRI